VSTRHLDAQPLAKTKTKTKAANKQTNKQTNKGTNQTNKQTKNKQKQSAQASLNAAGVIRSLAASAVSPPGGSHTAASDLTSFPAVRWLYRQGR